MTDNAEEWRAELRMLIGAYVNTDWPADELKAFEDFRYFVSRVTQEAVAKEMERCADIAEWCDDVSATGYHAADTMRQFPKWHRKPPYQRTPDHA